MADSKLTALTADTAPATTDVTLTTDDTAGTPVSKKVTWGNVATALAAMSGMTNAYQALGPRPSGDTTGATDTAALQAAITAADGKEVVIQGTYYINAALTIALYGTALIGQGMERQSETTNPTRIIQVTDNTPIIKIMEDAATSNGGPDGVRIENLTLEHETPQTSAQTSAVGILFSDGVFSQISVRNVFITGCAIGVQLEQAGTVGVFASTLDNVRINAYTVCAIDFRQFNGGGTGVVFSNIYTNAGGATLTEAPVRLAACLDFSFIGLHCEAYKARAGVEIERCYGVTFDGLHFEQAIAAAGGNGKGFITLINSEYNNVAFRGVSFYDCDVLTADVTTYYVLYSLSSGANNAQVILEAVTVHSSTTVTATTFGVVSITSTSTDSSVDVRNVIMGSGSLTFTESVAGLVRRFADRLTPFERRRIAPSLPTSALAQTLDRRGNSGSALAHLSTGRLSLFAIELEAGQVVSTITFLSSSTALSVGSNQWFSLWSPARAKLGVTNDDTSTAWAANVTKTLTLAAAYTVPVAGIYYIGICVVATTVPTLSGSVGAYNVGNIPPIMYGTSDTGLTNPASAPATAAAITAGVGMAYAYVS